MFFFSFCTLTNLWVWAVSVSGQCEKSKLVFTVRCKWTILTLSIQVLGWIEGFLDTRLLIWHHYEDVVQLIHVHYIGLTMSVALLREGGKYYRQCNSLRVSETFQRCLFSAVTKNWPALKFTRENELTNSLQTILLFPRAVIKQVINWPVNKIFWNIVQNLPFFACKSRVDKVYKTFDKNFMGFTSIIFVGQSQDAPS